MDGVEISDQTDPETASRILRLLVAAMALGLALSTGVFAFVGPASPDDPQAARVMLLALAATAVASLAGWTIFRRVSLASLRAKAVRHRETWGEELAPVQAFFNQVLVGAALAEAVGLTGAVAYLISGSVLGLAAVVAAFVALIGFYPREDSYRRFRQVVTGRGTTPV